MKLKSLLYSLGPLVFARPRLISEAGSEPSTNFRWWDSKNRSAPVRRLDLNHPPTPVGGISVF